MIKWCKNTWASILVFPTSKSIFLVNILCILMITFVYLNMILSLINASTNYHISRKKNLSFCCVIIYVHKLDQGALGIVGYIRIASFIRKHKFCSILFLSTLDLEKILEKTRVPLLKKVKTSFSLCLQEFYWCSFQYRKSKQTPKI